MIKLLKRHFHPLNSHILFWNIVLLIFIKIGLPHVSFQVATIIKPGEFFDSRDIVKITNDARSEHNLSALHPNFQLDTAANEKLNDMVRNNYFAHVSPSGVSPWFWIKNTTYTYKVAGENLAIGFFTAKDTVDTWLKSSSHRANILDERYRDIGVAVNRGKVNGHEGIIVVQMFGAPITAAFVPKASSPMPVRSFALVPLPTRIAGSNINVVEVQNGKPGMTEVVPQAVTTDPAASLVNKPLSFNNRSALKINNLLSTLNNIYLVYCFTMAVVAVTIFFLTRRNKFSPVKVFAHISIFLLTLIISAPEVYTKALIF